MRSLVRRVMCVGWNGEVVVAVQANPNNSVIGFHDNSSAIRGGPVTPLLPTVPGGPSSLLPQPRDWDLLLTAETHNFPCAVAPYPGAETGAGGRMRDTHATGIGSMMGAATAGYCVGNLRLEGAEMEHEVRTGARLVKAHRSLLCYWPTGNTLLRICRWYQCRILIVTNGQ